MTTTDKHERAVDAATKAWMDDRGIDSTVDHRRDHWRESISIAISAYLEAIGGDDGWMPIATAPMDGTPILAIYPWQGEPRFMVIRRHREHPWWMADHDNYIKHDDSKDTHRNFGFTHWRPLPAPPSIPSNGESGE